MIVLKLLNPRPLFLNYEDSTQLIGPRLDTLIYLAHDNQEQYKREYLVEKLMGDASPNSKKKFRDLLNRMPPLIKDRVITRDNDNVYFDREVISVDTHEFINIAQIALAKAHRHQPNALHDVEEALHYYRTHFLENYLPQFDGLLEWREEQRLELAHKRNMLLESAVRAYIAQHNLIQAKNYAKEWLESLNAGYIPLQYLIWITGNQPSYSQIEMDEYLTALEAYAEEYPIYTGLYADEWPDYLAKGGALPHALISIDLIPTVTLTTDDTATKSKLFGRQPLINQALQMVRQRTEKRLIALTGAPGSGKTVLLHAIGETLTAVSDATKMVYLRLSAQRNFARLLDELVQQLDEPQLQGLDFQAQKTQIKHVLQAHEFVILVDDYDGKRASQTILHELIDYIGQTPLILATPTLDDLRFKKIVVDGLASEDVQNIFAQYGVQISDEMQFAEFMRVTRGLPLLIHICLSFLKQGRYINLAELLARLRLAIQRVEINDTEQLYRSILYTLQQDINTAPRELLQLIALFDPLSGVSEEELNACPADKVSININLLQRLAMIHEIADYQISEAYPPRYSFHASVRSFLLPENLAEAPFKILKNFVTIIIAYVERHRQDFSQLDRFQNNILLALDIIYDSPGMYCDQATHGKFVQNIYYYFERRSLYPISLKLLVQIRDFYPDTPNMDLLKVVHMLGLTHIALSENNLAIDYLAEALTIAEAIQAISYSAKIYLDLATIDMKWGEFSRAEQQLEQAYDLTDDLLLKCRILINLGSCAFHQSNYAKAEDYYRQILDCIKQLESSNQDTIQLEFSAYQGLGIVFTNTRHIEEAHTYFDKASSLIKRMNDPMRVAYLFLNIGVLYYFEEDYDATYHNFLRGRTIAEQTGRGDLQTLFLMNLGSIQAIRYHYAESKKYLKQALVYATEFNVEHVKPQIYVYLGKLYLRQEFTQKAEKCFLTALQIAQSMKRFDAEALYGLVLNRLVDEFIIGPNDINVARRVMQTLADTYALELSDINAMTPEKLQAAHDEFKRDLHEIPDLDLYCVTAAILEWVGF